jgi:hypothetical protein
MVLWSLANNVVSEITTFFKKIYLTRIDKHTET